MHPGTTDLSDGALVHAALADDDEAFGVFYRRFHPRLVRLVLRKTGDRLLAEDVAQETIVRALDRLDTFDRTRPLWPWLKVIATNLAIDAGRKKSREVGWEPDDATVPAREMPSCEDGMLLAQALSKLPDRQRVAVSLRYLQDWESAEAASFLGLSIPAFEQLLFRARKKLRVEYGRVAQGAFGLFGLPWRWLRREAARLFAHVPGARRAVELSSQMGPVTWAQAAAGGLALLAALPAAPAGGDAGDLRRAPVALERGSDAGEAPARARRALAAGAGAAAAGGRAGAATGPAAVEEGPRPGAGPDPLRDLTDPNRSVKEPEDARIVSVAFAESTGGKRAFATGTSHCSFGACAPVLFSTRDGGSTWTRMPAEGFSGHTVLVPPGSDGSTLFAMGTTGLQVSEDGGRTFRTAAVAAPGPATGSVAVSPAFDRGDPTMLIGAQTLLRYDDTKATIHPEPSTTLSGPFEPVFAPAYPADRRYLMGGLKPDAARGLESAIFTCSGSLCTHKVLRDGKGVPKVRLRDDYATSNVAFAFTENHVYRSSDVWAFSVLPTPWEESSMIRDLALAGRGRTIFAAVHAIADGGDEGLYRSDDGGVTWSEVRSKLFTDGAAATAASGGRLLVALPEKGLACSADGGLGWSRRC